MMEISEDLMDTVTSYGDGSVKENSTVKESENLGDDLLEDLDSYLEDINERLTISRMVSDSVIKGMVNAVTQEASEKIAEKETEISELNQSLRSFYASADEKIEPFGNRVGFSGPENTKPEFSLNFPGALLEHDRMSESLGVMKVTAKEHFKKLEKELEHIKGSSGSVRRVNSSSELVGLSGILEEKVSERWVHVDKLLEPYKVTMDNVYKGMDDIVYLSKTSLLDWQQEQEFRGEIEAMVIRNSIQRLQEEFESKLWDQNTQFYASESIKWLEKNKEISNLRQDLDFILRSLSVHEIGHLNFHGSYEGGEERNNGRRTEHLLRRGMSDQIFSPTLVWEGNGKHENSNISIPEPENLEFSQLKHMPKDELFSYLQSEMTKMKRNNELIIQERTEEIFCLKRELLKERGSSLSLKKDKEFEALKKKIPDAISKLDDIILKNKKLPAFNVKIDNIGSLKVRHENLLIENRQLKDSLTEKKKEVDCLSLQLSDATEKISKHSLAEANLSRSIENIKFDVEDTLIKAWISEQVLKCAIREATSKMKADREESDMMFNMVHEIYEIVLRESIQSPEVKTRWEMEDSDMETFIMQGVCGFLLKEAIRDAKEKLEMKSTAENEIRVLQAKELEMETTLKSVVDEKERLTQEVLLMVASVEEKEKSALQLAFELSKEKERFESAAEEINELRNHVSQQQTLISESSKESDLIKGKLTKALEQIDLYKVEISKSNQKLDLAMKEFSEVDEGGPMLHDVSQEKQSTSLLVKAMESEHRRSMETIIAIVHGLSKAVVDFEGRVGKDLKRSRLRLEESTSELKSLTRKANLLRRTGVLYKKRLERRQSDLQKAEAEVDLLGDEVDALLSLLEKIYIALDHYSPVLQHYPGITETLTLIRRELSGASVKRV